MACARIRSILVLVGFLLLAAPTRGDVLSWLNKKIDGVLADQSPRPDVSPDFDRYLRFLTASQGAAGAPDGSSQGPYRPRLSEAFREVIPEGGDRDTTFFYQNVYLLGLLGGQLGFRTPFRVMGHLGEGIEPGIQLLAKILDEFRKNPEGIPARKLHGYIEKAMAQVQSTHQLMVESRETLEAVQAQVRKASDVVHRLLNEEGRLQSLPAVLGVSETLRKGADNVAAAQSTLNSSVTHFKTAFAELRLELADLDQVLSILPYASSDRLTLKDRPDRIRNMTRHLTVALSAMRESGVVVRTDLGLIRLNHQALMQILTTLAANPEVKSRMRDGEGLSDGEAGSVRGEVAFSRINPRLVDLVGQLAGFGRDMDVRRRRLEEWALGLRAFKAQPLVIENVPDWVFTDNTLPGKADRWTDLSLLPEREKDIDGILKTLESDFKVGVTREEAERRARVRQTLDENLGDVDPRGTSGVRPSPEAGPLRPADLDAIEAGHGSVAGPSATTSVPSGAPTTGSSTPYDLPSWF